MLRLAASDQGKIRVLLVDDMAVVRQGFAELVRAEPDLLLVGEATDGNEAVELYHRLRPDVVVLDLKMPRKNGFESLEAIRKIDPKARVLILTIREGDQDITQSLSLGASGYLHKSVSRDEFVSAIRNVSRGILVIPPYIAGRVAEHLTSKSLTSREVQVLRLIGEGKANKEIAHELRITEGTVKSHVLKILHKLDCWSRVEAVTIAYRRGYLWPHFAFLLIPCGEPF